MTNYKEITKTVLDILYNDKNYFKTIKTLIEENNLELSRIIKEKDSCLNEYSAPMKQLLSHRFDNFKAEYVKYLKDKDCFNILKEFEFNKELTKENLSTFTKYTFTTVNNHAKEFILKFLTAQEKQDYEKAIIRSNNNSLKFIYLKEKDFNGYKEAFDLKKENNQAKIEDFIKDYNINNYKFDKWSLQYQYNYNLIDNTIELAETNYKDQVARNCRDSFYTCVCNEFNIDKLKVETEKAELTPGTLKIHAEKYYNICADEQEKYLYDKAKECRKNELIKEQQIRNKTLTEQSKHHDLYIYLLSVEENEAINYIVNIVNSKELYNVSRAKQSLFNHEIHQCLSNEQLNILKNIFYKASKTIYRNKLNIKKTNYRNKKQIIGKEMAIESLEKLNKILDKTKMVDNDLIFKNNKATINDYLECIKDYLPNYYERINNRVVKLRELNLMLLRNKTRQVVESIVCNFDGTKNKLSNYTVLDYYLETDISLELFYKLIPEVSNSFEQTKVRTFLGLYKNQEKLDEEDIYNNAIYYIKDNNQTEITNEEKENIISYLEENNIPITTSTYNIAIYRYIKGMLILNQNKKLVK